MADELPTPDVVYDGGDTGCGELLIELAGVARKAAPGAIIEVIARDSGAPQDIPAWCRMRGFPLVAVRGSSYFFQNSHKSTQ